ncbi:MAG: FAD-dependent oxidoreductase [Betaproteobacteria bacterium]
MFVAALSSAPSYTKPPECGSDAVMHRPVIVVGAGPVGLTLAIDLARQGTPVLLLDDDDRLSSGSRAICFAKRTLEIWDRLGCGDPIADRGVSWRVGKLYVGDRLVYAFDLLPEAGHRRPAFVNIAQHDVEALLYAHALAQPGLEIRWKNRVVGVRNDADGVLVNVETPDGDYRAHCDWLVACDGSRSPVRQMLGLATQGRLFRDRFLIADIRMAADLPTERRFWFSPPFHPDGCALMHRQPDAVWRIDFQLGWDADPAVEREPERVAARVRAMLGDDTPFELVWSSVYTFSCMRMEHFRHGRVLFAGDAAHGVSPFGARGANSGVQDADNLGWKLHHVVRGVASDALLDSYAAERERAADENIAHSTRSAEFLTPTTPISRLFRDAVLDLAAAHPFARTLVNSGRLSTATTLAAAPLGTADRDHFAGAMIPGAAAADAPVTIDGRDGWFLNCLGGRFVAVHFARTDAARAPCPVADALRAAAVDLPFPIDVLVVAPSADATPAAAVVDTQRMLAARYDGVPGTTYLMRPDQHVCARWRGFDAGIVRAAAVRAACVG